MKRIVTLRYSDQYGLVIPVPQSVAELLKLGAGDTIVFETDTSIQCVIRKVD